MINIDKIATPILITLCLAELLSALNHHERKHSVRDRLSNILLGIFTMLTGLLMKGVAFSFHSFIYTFSIIRPEGPGLWIAAFFLCDFVHYCYHAAGHYTRFFWAAHVTHHSSLHFNFSVGFRINFIHLLYRFLFWSPLCLVGIKPEMILFFESLAAIWNFIIHTERVGKLGILDWIFNTPSNHRVHHASNPEYLDKNIGGILMIYDHLFGTYRKETQKPVYGITRNINSTNPAVILFHEYIHLFSKLKKVKGFGNKIRYLITAPTAHEEPMSHQQPKISMPDFSSLKNAI
jgi:sterol desaturase/sphingolipid hydroxylase (fatty acid hydroxylase superfamily)